MKKKKIIILSDLSQDELYLTNKIVDIFSDCEVKIFFYDGKKNIFLDGKREVHDLDEELLFIDGFINLLDTGVVISKEISQKMELLKISTMQNSLDNRIIFSSKNSIKKIFEKYEYKTPVFDILPSNSAGEIFSNFIQPSRIFSKKNDFFSGRISNIEEMEKVINEIPENRQKYCIEEYLEGDDFFAFIYKKEGEIFSYVIKENENIELEESREICTISKKFFKNVGLNKFCLIHFKKHHKRGVFFLNIFVEMNILVGKNREILNKILEKEGKKVHEVFSF